MHYLMCFIVFIIFFTLSFTLYPIQKEKLIYPEKGYGTLYIDENNVCYRYKKIIVDCATGNSLKSS